MAYPSRLAVGQVLGDRFQIASLVGSGDLGEVYDGREVGTGYSYAVKTLPSSLLHTAGIAAFQQLAQRVTELHNDALLGVYAFDVEATAQQPYIVRELVATPSLQQTIESSGPLQASAFAPIVSGIGAALEVLHGAGIVHGNLKPSNVFPAASGVRLCDAGQAYLRGPACSTGLWGSPGFLPFEQTSAPPDHPSADLYALGVLVFYALTGRLPFRAAQGQINVAALLVELQSPLPPASHRARELGATLGDSLDAWFSRALATSPAARFPSAASLADSFRAAALMSAEPPFASPETSASYTNKGTLMLGQLPPEVAALVAGLPAAGPSSPAHAGLGGTMVMSGAAVAGEVAISLKAERPVASTELATVPPGRLPAPPSLGGASYEAPGGGAYAHHAGTGHQPASETSAPPGGSTPPMAGPASAPQSAKKKGKGPLIIGGILALLLVTGGIVAVLFAFVFTDAPEASGPATTVPSASAAVSTTPSGQLPEPAAPPASTAAMAPPPPAAEVTDSRVTLVCDPACDSVVCDKKQVADPASGVRLGPGAHTCVGKKAGYAAASVTFTTTPGTDAPQTLTLAKLPEPPKGGGKKAPCGTFVNPCK